MAAAPQAAQGERSQVSAWGRLSNELHWVQPLRSRRQLHLGDAGQAPGLAFGNGRSYGDACLNPGGRLWATRGLDRFIDFDHRSGIVECEAGVLLDDIIRVALPHGWFLPVTPGTRFVTLGGAVAHDVHGKNHHSSGTFGEHVLSLELARTDGTRILCSPADHAEWLSATIGGMGLTGVIVSLRLQLKAAPGPWIATETLPYASLDQFFRLSRESERDWEYTVSWVDCTHGRGAQVRGLFIRGNHAAHPAQPPAPRRLRVPFTPPLSLVNRATLRAFNAAYFHKNRRQDGARMQHLLPFFYPLDGLLEWNRIYGPRGFYQYQCVIPRPQEEAGTAALLQAIRDSGRGSFLAVLKTFGERPAAGLMSFPMAGTTLALDFPNEGATTAQLFARLDAIVARAGGRIYAAKDARMPAELFANGYPQLAAFRPFRDPGISSALSRRLMDRQP